MSVQLSQLVQSGCSGICTSEYSLRSSGTHEPLLSDVVYFKHSDHRSKRIVIRTQINETEYSETELWAHADEIENFTLGSMLSGVPVGRRAKSVKLVDDSGNEYSVDNLAINSTDLGAVLFQHYTVVDNMTVVVDTEDVTSTAPLAIENFSFVQLPDELYKVGWCIEAVSRTVGSSKYLLSMGQATPTTLTDDGSIIYKPIQSVVSILIPSIIGDGRIYSYEIPDQRTTYNTFIDAGYKTSIDKIISGLTTTISTKYGYTPVAKGVDGVYILPPEFVWMGEGSRLYFSETSSRAPEIYGPFISQDVYRGYARYVNYGTISEASKNLLEFVPDISRIDSVIQSLKECNAPIEMSVDGQPFLNLTTVPDNALVSILPPASSPADSISWDGADIVEVTDGTTTRYTFNATLMLYNIDFNMYGYGNGYSRAHTSVTKSAFISTCTTSGLTSDSSDADVLDYFPNGTMISPTEYIVLPEGYFWLSATSSNISYKTPKGCVFKWVPNPESSDPRFVDVTFSQTQTNVSRWMIDRNQTSYYGISVVTSADVVESLARYVSDNGPLWKSVISSSTYEFTIGENSPLEWVYSSPTATTPTGLTLTSDKSKSFVWNSTVGAFIDTTVQYSSTTLGNSRKADTPSGTWYLCKDAYGSDSDTVYWCFPPGWNVSGTTLADPNQVLWQYRIDDASIGSYFYTNSGKLLVPSNFTANETVTIYTKNAYRSGRSSQWPSSIRIPVSQGFDLEYVAPDGYTVIGALIPFENYSDSGMETDDYRLTRETTNYWDYEFTLSNDFKVPATDFVPYLYLHRATQSA